MYTFIESKQSGIDFNNTIKETPTEHLYTFNYIYNGAGVAIADFDNDGWQDIYFTGNQVPDRIYKNLKILSSKMFLDVLGYRILKDGTMGFQQLTSIVMV